LRSTGVRICLPVKNSQRPDVIVIQTSILSCVFGPASRGSMPSRQSQINYMRWRITMGRLGHSGKCANWFAVASENCSLSSAATFDISGGRTT
jgi:hypothetical protein